MVLLVITADGIDLYNPGHLGDLWADNPVLYFAQCGGIPRLAVFPGCARFGGDRIHVDLSQAGGNGSHFGLQARRQHALDGREAGVDPIAGKVDVRAFLKHHGDL